MFFDQRRIEDRPKEITAPSTSDKLKQLVCFVENETTAQQFPASMFYREFSRLLAVAAFPTKNWKHLARVLGYSEDKLLYFQAQTDPPLALLDEWKYGEDTTCGKLIQAFIAMGHYEGAQMVREWIGDKESQIGT